MNTIIYDCEIVKGIPPRGEDPLPDVEYCAGWRDFENMGVSVTGVYDYNSDAYRVFCDDNVGEMLELMHHADLIVGFNNEGYDDPLLSATYEGFTVVSTPRYDLLVEVWRAAGLKPSWGSPQTHGGYGLDAMCEANFEVRKTGHGAMAPVNWQRGRIGSVIDYCLNDVRMTKMMLDKVLAGQALTNPKDEWSPLLLRHPDVKPEHYGPMPEGGVTVEVERDETYEDRAGLAAKRLRTWDDIALTFMQSFEPEGYDVEVQDNDGIVVKTFTHLHEWSGEVTSYINAEDAEGLIGYLIGLNTTTEGPRDGTIIG